MKIVSNKQNSLNLQRRQLLLEEKADTALGSRGKGFLLVESNFLGSRSKLLILGVRRRNGGVRTGRVAALSTVGSVRAYWGVLVGHLHVVGRRHC